MSNLSIPFNGNNYVLYSDHFPRSTYPLGRLGKRALNLREVSR